MTQRKSKTGLQPMLIKYMALVMGVCYLANPFHRQIRTVFHEISHLLESPGTILSHPSPSSAQLYNAHGTHGDREHVHAGGEHRMASDGHEHGLLDFMDALFDSNDGYPEKDALLALILCDKHINSQYYPILRIHILEFSRHPFTGEEKTKMGHGSVLYEPPRQLLPSV